MKEIEKAENRYKEAIRKYTTCDVLEYFSIKSIEAYLNNQQSYLMVNLPYRNSNGSIGTIKGFGYGQWELIQVCFNSIRFSNDYRGKKVDEPDFYHLINENKIYDEKAENVVDMDATKLYEHLQCLTNVQFDFQTLFTKNQFNRMYQIIMKINNNSNYAQTSKVNYINFKNIFYSITGFEIEKFIRIYFFLVIISLSRKKANIHDIINDLQFNVEELGFSKLDIKNIIEYQSRNYDFYRETDNWNALKYYPIVKTNKNDNQYIISNIFSLLLSFPYSIYWIIRNYYKDNNDASFTNYFGKCFEYYFLEILEHYKIGYQKLKESRLQGQKTPDIRIETNSYVLLIEQKATLFPIDARITTKEKRYEKLEHYIDTTLAKAFKQLNVYDEECKSKTVIRICLTFEKIYIEENIKRILETRMEFKTEKALNWIVNIDEMEVLMQLLAEDENKFNDIIEKKIKLEREDDPNGRTIEKLLEGYKYDYVTNHINHFDNIMKDFLEKLKVGKK